MLRSDVLVLTGLIAASLAPSLAAAQGDSTGDTSNGGEVAGEEDVDEWARELYLRGERHYAGGQYEEAVSAFSESFELSGRPQLQFNLANAYERLGEYEEAIAALRQYAPHAPEYDHDTIARRIRNLESRVEAQESSGERGRQSPAIIPTTPEESSDGVSGGSVLVLGTGIAILAAASVFGVLALGNRSDLDGVCMNGICPESASSVYDEERTFSLIADIGFVIGGIAVITGATWLLAGLDP